MVEGRFLGQRHSFTFDTVFMPEASQEDVFVEISQLEEREEEHITKNELRWRRSRQHIQERARRRRRRRLAVLLILQPRKLESVRIWHWERRLKVREANDSAMEKAGEYKDYAAAEKAKEMKAVTIEKAREGKDSDVGKISELKELAVDAVKRAMDLLSVKSKEEVMVSCL
ncbi:hypothetical protein LOK49_LG05G00848 [Camellia lanceoleosa]|uniref:Uncharacterized protein n=1 Tax=Camellia lanceoleosa TaxID=1840588 RepID=A0ACC0HL11_9ERIC|nr:hypothetical protein LOK49_LG05G00848 [Camellia lanceoleosa]